MKELVKTIEMMFAGQQGNMYASDFKQMIQVKKYSTFKSYAYSKMVNGILTFIELKKDSEGFVSKICGDLYNFDEATKNVNETVWSNPTTAL